jgi:hypothetical protein
VHRPTTVKINLAATCVGATYVTVASTPDFASAFLKVGDDMALRISAAARVYPTNANTDWAKTK